jgi:DNA-binding protein Fis
MGRPQATDVQKMAMELVSTSITQAGPDALDLHDRVVSLVEKEVILQVLRSCQGTQTKTAERLGINRNTLHKKISDYQLESEAR